MEMNNHTCISASQYSFRHPYEIKLTQLLVRSDIMRQSLLTTHACSLVHLGLPSPQSITIPLPAYLSACSSLFVHLAWQKLSRVSGRDLSLHLIPDLFPAGSAKA